MGRSPKSVKKDLQSTYYVPGPGLRELSLVMETRIHPTKIRAAGAFWERKGALRASLLFLVI